MPDVETKVDKLTDIAAEPFADLDAQRVAFTQMGAALPRPEVGAVSEHAAPSLNGEVPVRLYRPVGRESPPLLIFLHGGGWIFGDLNSHDAACRQLVAEADCAVAAVAYRLAPEYPFPAALEDCVAAAEWLLDRAGSLGLDADRVALGGESAGANLAAVAIRHLNDRDGRRPMMQLLIHPPTDFRLTSQGIDANPTQGLDRGTLTALRDAYLPEGGWLDPDASPLLAEDLSGLPPALLITVEADPLTAEGEAYAARLAASGVETTLVRLPGLAHGFMFVSAEEPLVRDAYRRIGTMIQRAFAPIGARQPDGMDARSRP